MCGRSSPDKPEAVHSQKHTQHAAQLNCDRVTELRAQVLQLSTDAQVQVLSTDGSQDVSNLQNTDQLQTEEIKTGENNNSIHKTCEHTGQKLQNTDIYINNNLNKDTHKTTNSSVKQISPTHTQTLPGHGSKVSSQKDKPVGKERARTLDSRSRRGGRSRGRSNAKGEMTRQRLIMNNIGELLEHRLDPYPLLPRLVKAEVVSESQVQVYLGMSDRRAVCESLVDVLGDGPPHLIPRFCDVLACTGHSAEILEVGENLSAFVCFL